MNEVEAFKNELKNLKFYVTIKKDYIEQIENLYHVASGMSGRGVGDGTRCTNTSLKEEHKLETFEKIEKLKEKEKLIESKINYINSILDQTRFKNVLVNRYVHNITYEVLGRRMNYSGRGLQYVVEKDLKRILREK